MSERKIICDYAQPIGDGLYKCRVTGETENDPGELECSLEQKAKCAQMFSQAALRMTPTEKKLKEIGFRLRGGDLDNV